LLNLINKIKKRFLPIYYSFFFEIGRGCLFGNISFAGKEKNSIKIGNNVTIFRYTELCGKKNLPIIIGDGTFINQQCVIRPNIKIGRHVSIGPGVMLLSDSHEIGPSEMRAGKSIYPPIHIGDGCWIGANSTIIGNVKVGKGTIIGAGSLVNKNCEPDSLYAGVPARFIKKLK